MKGPFVVKELIVALDLPDPARAKSLVRTLGRAVTYYKVAPSLYFQDPSIVSWLTRGGKRVFLDFKWYDIPSQMKRSVLAAADMGLFSCTVHASAGPRALAEVAKARPRPLIWAVTALTSMDKPQLRAIGVEAGVKTHILRLARMVQKAGLDGLVCSALEAAWLRRKGIHISLVTPGIALEGKSGTDQKRLSTAAQAWKAGANFIVVGRAILDAPHPKEAVQKIYKERG